MVAAASYEARRFGIHSATSIYGTAEVSGPRLRPAALRRLPGGPQQIRAIFAEYTLLVEPLSLDEAYLDVTENLKGIPSATQIAQEIRARSGKRLA